jgi:peroxiredoxin Q/BCP
MSIDVGSAVPDITLPTDGGAALSLASLKGRKVVLYFYPKDDTSGCTAEACAFQEDLPDFTGADAVIIGVSKDTAAKHDKFKAKYNLAFPLLSDEEGKLCEAFGVWVEKSMYGRKYFGIERSTFLIDANGLVAKVWRKVKVTGHAKDVLAAVKAL